MQENCEIFNQDLNIVRKIVLLIVDELDCVEVIYKLYLFFVFNI